MASSVYFATLKFIDPYRMCHFSVEVKYLGLGSIESVASSA